MSPRRKGQVRFGYKKLSPAYRKRLERNGITQRAWENGADLRKARGKAGEGKIKISKTRQAQIDRAVRAQATPSEIRELEAIITRPTWIPKGVPVRTEVAAALSQLPNPRTWKHTYITPAEDGKPWTMTIYRKRAKYPVVIEIPGGGGAEGEAPREVIDVLKAINIEYQAEKEIDFDSVFWSVMDTDMKAPKK